MTAIAEQMAADAAEAMKYTRRHFVVELDYSPESVERLESAAGDVPFAINGGASPENIDHLTRIWGAYVGEVLRRTAGCSWQQNEAGEPALQTSSGLQQPHEAVRQRLSKPDEALSLVVFFQQCQSS